MDKYLLALDQGTTGSRSIVFNQSGEILSMVSKEFRQIFPREGWVEHDANDIWFSQIEVALAAVRKLGISPKQIDSIGITNQRETTIVWDRITGEPVSNAIVWQCRRTAKYCDELRKNGYADMIREKTGLLIDSYFSATKLKWILDNVSGARERANRGELLFGTVDSWLIYKLTAGKVHATDYSNAARTMLYNINTLQWDADLLRLFDIPLSLMPNVLPSSHIYGYTDRNLFGVEIPICGVAGDQQAALFGQCCFSAGCVKNTYGTGGFLLMNTGEKPIYSDKGLLTTIAWGLDGKVNYALEGSVFICGAAIQWLRDGLGILTSASESEFLASSVPDTGDVFFVPSFVGLGAPYWDAYARGVIIGLTRGTTKAHIVRATLEAMAYQTADVLSLMEDTLQIKIESIKVDGGACANNLLLQFQSDILSVPIVRPRCIETTALGASYLAGLASGYFSSTEEIENLRFVDRVFSPNMPDDIKIQKLGKWHRAVERSKGWIIND